MNIKILVDTLIEIPDQELLVQLSSQIKKHKSLIISDIRKFFHMLSCLFSGKNRKIKIMALQLYRYTFSIMLPTEIELSWNEVSQSLIWMLGEEDSELRKKAKHLILDMIEATGNANSILEKIYLMGMHDESVLVIVSSIRLVEKVIEEYPTLLHTKTNVNIMKQILEKIVAFSMMGKHIDIEKSSKQFLDHLFFIKVDKLDEVLLLMNDVYIQRLQKIWAVNKQRMLIKQQEEESIKNGEIPLIKYEHLPLINGKFFGVYEPYVLKNLFNPDTPSAKVVAIKHFHENYLTHEQQLTKFTNVIYKILLKFIHESHHDLLLILKKLLLITGISNIIGLHILPSLLIPQLNAENVPYRKDLRQIIKNLHFLVPSQCLKIYEKQMQENGNMGWIQLFQILQLLEHWIDNNVQSSYPPALDFLLKHLCHGIENKSPKIKDKSEQLLLTILDRYGGYRQNIEDHFSEQKIGELQDMIEKKKIKGKKSARTEETQEIYMREYKEERERYLNFSKLMEES